MNKHLYRVIFNKRRGQLIVVAEISSADAADSAGSAKAEVITTDSTNAKQGSGTPRPLGLLLWTVFGVLTSFSLPVHAQIISDSGAPGKQRPTVLQTANGVVQVNIQTPSEAGVSRNSYSQFDVTRTGAVLNNSRSAVQTQIGGWVQANPWLLRNNARVILNEVNSANPSQLRGYLEVAGQRAEVVIANPSGIDVDGAGFINASRVTITTGVPQIRDGNLEGILVQQGSVTINGQGLDTTQADYAGILARAVRVNANIWAKDLQVITGTNRIDPSATASPLDASGARPTFAIDVTHLGGMYAGQITLVGTEAGVGVKNAGTIEASSGSLTLNANGWLTNSGTILATAPKASAAIVATGNLNNSGTFYSSGDIRVTSHSDITNNGLIAAQKDVSVAAVGATSRIEGQAGAIFASGLMSDGSVGASGNLNITATTIVSHHGKMISGSNTQVSGSALDVSSGSLQGDQINLAAKAGDVDAHMAEINAKDMLVLTAAQSLATDSATVVAKQLRVAASNWSNVSGEVLQSGSGDTDITLSARNGRLDNSGGRIAGNSANLTVGADILINTDGKIEHAGTGTLAIRAGMLDDEGGQITGNGVLDVAAGGFDHRGAVTTASQIMVSATSLDNHAGRITQLGEGLAAITVSGTLANSSGTIESNGDTTVNAAALDNSGGRITAIGSATVGTKSSLNNTNGLVAAGMHLAVQGRNVDNNHGTLQAQVGNATLRVADLTNTGGSIYAGGRLDTLASGVSNTGILYAGGDQRLEASNAVANSGTIAAQGSTTVIAHSLSSDASSLLGAGVKADGSLAQIGDLNITTSQELAVHGQNLAAGRATLQGAGVDLSGSHTGATSIGLQANSSDVTTSGAMVAAAGKLGISATTEGHGLVNTRGILSGGQLEVEVANLNNWQGTLIQDGARDSNIVMQSANGVLDNTQGRIAVNGKNLRIGATTLANVDGRVEHAGAGTLNIASGNFNDERGTVASNGSVALAADELNHNGAFTSASEVSLHADMLSNRGGRLLQSGAVGGISLEVTRQLDNAGGEIAGDGHLSMQAGAIDNSHGRITSGNSAQLSSGGHLNNMGGVLAAEHDLGVAVVTVDNTHGVIQAGGALVLDAGSLLNINGTLSAAADLTARVAGSLHNDGLMYAAHNQTINAAGALINTGSIAAGGDTTIKAGSLDSGAGGLLGAGIRTDGSLAPTGSLTVQVTQGLIATGQNLGAGGVSLIGNSIDLRGGATAGANVAIVAGNGDVHTSNASVSTNGTLSVTANQSANQVLDNAHGDLSAGQLILNLANLDNNHGNIVQTGTGATDITLLAEGGTLDNTAGRIAVNSGNLTLGAGTLENSAGRIEHAGSGALAIRALTLDDQHGEIVSNGALDIATGGFDHRNATTAAQQVTIAAAIFDNSTGHIAQMGAGPGAITVGGKLANSAGTIESNGDVTVSARSLDNSGGRITAIGSTTVAGSAGLNNSDGLVAAGMHLVVQGGSVDNSRGMLQAQGGDATIRIGDLNNANGSAYAAGKLDMLAANVTNTGTLYAGADQRLDASGAVTNSGTIAAGGNTTLNAHSVSSNAHSLLGAGIKADGSLSQSGDLSIMTGDGLAAHGQNIAAGQTNLQGATVDLSGSQTGGASIALRASAGDVTTIDAAVATSGVLAITATTEGHGLVNTHGKLGGGQLTVQVANLQNGQGTLVQSGSGDSNIVLSSASGGLDNTAGQIAINGNNVSITAATLTNVDGRIEHAGKGALNLAAASFNDERGNVASNGMVAVSTDELNHNGATTSAAGVSVNAGTLSNRSGHLLQSGAGGVALEVTRQLDNAGGEIAGDGSLSLKAGAIDNNHGRITTGDSASVSSTGQLNNIDGILTAAHSLTAVVGAVDNTQGAFQAGDAALTLDAASLLNSKGVLSAGTDLTARIAGDLSNDTVVYAGHNQTLNVGGVVTNTGSIAAQGNTSIAAASINSGAGSLLGAGIRPDGSLAPSGALTIQTRGNLAATGQNLAVGDVSLSGASIDMRNSQSAGANITLAASSGDVHTTGSSISTAGVLSVTANTVATQVFDNAQGSLRAGQLVVNVANLDNTQGTMIQTGTADANIIVSDQGRLDNTAGHIAVNSTNLTLGAHTLANTDGKIEHAGNGTLTIRAGTLDDQRGQIAGNGGLEISANDFDHRDATTSANQIAITATVLDNHAGRIAQMGTGTGLIIVSGSLANSAGKIESNGNSTVTAGSLDNSGGRITAAGNTTVGSGADLNNTNGVVAAGVHLVVQAGNVNNSGGSLQAQGGDATLGVTDLNNSGGTVYAAGKLDTVAANVINTGLLYAGSDQRLEASGSVINSGTIAAQGSTMLNSRSLSSDAASLLGAGVKADGTLDQAGNLSITTMNVLSAHGQNLAGGQVSLQGAAVDVSGSHTSGTRIGLNASVGDVDTSGATVATAGTLSISATTEEHGLVNAGGTLSGAQLELSVANLDNRQGMLVQSGGRDGIIELSSPSGMLDNTGGHIAVNGHNLRIGAATLANVDGHIEHAGTGLFDISAGEIHDQHGEITGNGVIQITTGAFDHREAATSAEQLSVNAGTLDNSHGLIAQKGSANTSISTISTLNNSGGTIASNGSTTISATELNNTSGTLTSAGAGNLTIEVGGNVDNSQGGLIAAVGDVAISAGAVLNQSGKINSGSALKVDASGAIENAQGSIIAHGNAQLTATQLTNSSGTVATELGNLSINTSAVTNNDSGVIQAGADITLTNYGLSNTQGSGAPTGGSIVGRNVDIVSNGQALRNVLGTIASSQNLTVRSGALDNASGLIQSGGVLALDTNGGDLNNSNAGSYAALHAGTPGGIISGGSAQLRVGVWNNGGGFFGAGGTIDAQATAALDNGESAGVGGQIVGGADLGLTAERLNNQGGQIQALGNLTVKATAGSVNNSGSLIRSGGTLDISANGVDNSNTQGSGQGLEGHDIVLAAPSLNNEHGAIRADENADIKAGISLINTQGLISAGRALTVGAPASGVGLTIDNSEGTLIGGSSANVKAASMSGGGHLLSLGDLALDLSGDFLQAQGAELVADKSLSLKVAGDISNLGKLSAGANLDIEARNVDNAASGEISSSGITHVTAAGALHNRGLIDGNATELDAGTVDNAGTGRIYGGSVSIAAGLLTNDVEGATAGTIAARARLDIGVQTLNNREHALIFSAGDLAIGGGLDANRLASGRAANVTNASASIEALGNLNLNAGQVNNLNNHFSTELLVIGTESVTEYSLNNAPTRYSADQARVIADRDDPNISLLRVAGNDYETWAHYDFTRTTKETVITNSDPGRIVAGGNLLIGADGVLNDNSHILAGGLVGITGALTNTETLGERITSEFGTATDMWRIHKKGTDDQGSASSVYAPPDVIESISVKDSRIEEQTASVGGAVPSMTSAGGVTGSTSSAGNATVAVNAGAIVKVSTSAGPVNAASGIDASTAAGANGPTGRISNGSTRLVSIGSATGDRATVSGSIGQASSAGPMQIGFNSRQVAGNEVSGAAGLTGQDRTDAVLAIPPRAVDSVTGLPVSAATGPTGGGSAALSVPNTTGSHEQLGNVGVTKTDGIDPSARTQALGVAQAALEHTTGGVQIVRTTAPSFQLPSSSLFQVDPSPSAAYLVETDPRFVNYQQWIGSEYLLKQTKLDPGITQKRLGDAFYEQKLVRDQVAQLTGQRFLADYTSDDEQYRSLMDAGIAYAKDWNLRPGVALTSEQMAALTKDMVWLVTQEVTLADGTVQKVLAPQVYVASHNKDLTGAGAVISGHDVKAVSTGDLTNTGSIIGRNTAQLVADNINNLGGRIHADSVLAHAKTDINNIAGTISAGHELIATAGRDINVETTTRSATSSVGGNEFTRTTIDRIGSLAVAGPGGTLIADAGRDINLVAAKIDNAGKDGNTLLNAGRNLNLATVTTASSNSITWDPVRYRKESSSTEVGTVIQGAGGITFKAGNDINLRAASVDAGAALTAIAGNNLNILAGVGTSKFDETTQTTKSGFLHRETITTRNMFDGTSAIGSVLGGATVDLLAGHDLKVLGSSVVGDKDVNLVAKNAISIEAATNQSHETHYLNVKESGLLSGGGFGISFGTRTTTTNHDQDAITQSGQARSTIGSIAGNVMMNAGDSIKIAGTALSAAHDIDLVGKSVSITPGVDALNGKYTTKMTQDAFTLALTGTVVNAIQTTQQMQTASTQVKSGRLKALAAATAATAAANAAKDIAANGLNIGVSLTVGHSESEQATTTVSTTHVGSLLTAGNDINIAAIGGGKASNIDIVGSDVQARNNISLTADNQVNLLAAQDFESQHSQSKSMSAAAGVAATVGTKGVAYGYTASAGASRGSADGEGTTQVNTHVDAGGQLNIGSGGDTNLKGAVASANRVIADVKGNLNIESLKDTAKFDSKNQSMSVSATVGMGASVSGSYNQSSVHNDYASVQEQSGIRAGDGGFQVAVGGNTDLKGGVISSSTAGAASSTLVTATLTQSDISNHAMVDASSAGISGGVKVAGQAPNASSTEDGKPGFFHLEEPKGGTGVSLSGGAALSTNASGITRSGIGAGNLMITDDVGQRALTDQSAAQTAAGINRNVVTGGDTSGRVGNDFNPNATKSALEIGNAFSSAASPLAANFVGDIARAKEKTAEDQAEVYRRLADDAAMRGEAQTAQAFSLKADDLQAAAISWGDNGLYRLTMHAAAQGLIGGGVSGNAGALSSISGVVGGNLGQRLGERLGETAADRQGLQGQAREDLINSYQQTLATLGGAVAGVASSRESGNGGKSTVVAAAAEAANTANTIDVFNRQLHPGDRRVTTTLAAMSGGKYTEKEIQDALRYAGLRDRSGNVLVPEGTAEVFVNASNILTGTTLQDTSKSDPTFPLGSGDKTTQLEQAPARPSNELITFIIANTGGAKSPYILTSTPTYSSHDSLPPAPEGTTRVTLSVDGAAYRPLVAPCPVGSCTNGDPIAYAIQDPGTAAYLQAVARKGEKDLNIVTALFGFAGAVFRGVSTVGELASAGARVADLASSGVVSSGAGLGAVDNAKSYGVTFFGDDILPFYGPSKATIGNPNGAPSFFMPLEDASLVKNAHDAAVYTGMAPSAQKAYLSGGEIYGFSFPTDGLRIAKPTTIDAGGWPHFLEGGNTAVKLEGPNAGYMVTPVREFVTSGSSPVPPGSILFKIGPNGEWITMRKW